MSKQTHINNIIKLIWNEKEDFEKLVREINILKDIDYIKEKVSEITWKKERIKNYCNIEHNKTNENDNEEIDKIKELAEINEKIYNNMLDNFETVLKEESSKKVLIQIPSTHAKDFIPKLIERKLNKNSYFYNIDIEYFIFDSESSKQISENEDNIESGYNELINKINESDKFIEIKDSTLNYTDFIKWSDSRDRYWDIKDKYMWEIRELWKSKYPRLLTYLPSKQQAEETWMNLLKYSKIWEIWTRLNIQRIREAWEELVKLLKNTKKIRIKWNNSDIEIDIEDKFIMNSWGRTNMPWAEVFTSPKLNWVDWIITFDEENIIKMLSNKENRSVKWLSLIFEKWKVVKVEIKSDEINSEEKAKIIKKINELLDEVKTSSKTWNKLNENWQNRYTWEIAFWITPHIIAWSLIHQLFSEKAFWMHIALWNSYKYKWMFNWNENASFHWDIIWSMKWNTVSLELKNWDTLDIMKDWGYNKKHLPKISEYREEVLIKISHELKELWVL